MICRNCGTELNEGAEFCAKCGQKTQSSENYTSENKSMDILTTVTIILLAIQVITYLCLVLFSDISKSEGIDDSSSRILSILQATYGGLKVSFFIFGGIILLIVSVAFIAALVKKSQKMLKISCILGIIVSFGVCPISIIPYIVFFILLLAMLKGKKIPSALPIVFLVIGALIPWFVLTYFESTLHGVYFIGFSTGTIAYALLTVILKKKAKL